jgi:hypothetical protein
VETKVILALLLGNLPKSWRDFRFRFFRGDDCERIDVAAKISFSDLVSGKHMGLGLGLEWDWDSLRDWRVEK